MTLKICTLALLLTNFVIALAIMPQPNKINISGNIRDADNGGPLIGVTVCFRELKNGTVTNKSGYYTMSIPKGKYTIEVSYLGYQTQVLQRNLTTSQTLNLELKTTTNQMKEIVVLPRSKDFNLRSNEMSTKQVSINTIRKVPSLMGEVDLLKVIQLLPGVVSAGEGSSSFSVRGGGIDQNLIVLDETTLYNASHMLGFFSVFNNDAVKSMTLYKGDIPPSYGGRLSSILDVDTKDGNSKRFSGCGGVGLISSRLTFEGPLASDKTSFIVSARRTYADLFLKFAPNKDIRDNRLYFYDLNAKINHRFDDKNRISLSAYNGEDVFDNSDAGFRFGNAAISACWTHLFSQKLFSNLSFHYSRYKYCLQSEISKEDNFDWKYNMRDFNLRDDFSWYLSPNHTLKFGYIATYHTLQPGRITTTGSSFGGTDHYELPDVNAIETSLYGSDEWQVSKRFAVKIGLRTTYFARIDKGTVYNYDENYQIVDSSVYKSEQITKAYYRLSPRLGLNYRIDDQSSVKASYARTNQYLQMASNATTGTPLDLWFMSGKNVKPQGCNQIAVGYFRNFFKNTIETSVELFYKAMEHTIDFKDHAQLLLNNQLEGELRYGYSRAKGIEFQLQKIEGKLTGWISYTYSHSQSTIKGINNDQPYRSPYDRPHTLYIVGNYELNSSLSFGTNFVYASGQPITYPVGRMEIGGAIVPVYSQRNANRMPDYHRLDLSLTWIPRGKKHHRWSSEWNVSVYNVYGRKNAWAINFEQEENNPYKTKAEMTYLFTVVPSITYNFKF